MEDEIKKLPEILPVSDTPPAKFDWDAIGKNYLADAQLRRCQERFKLACPPELHPDVTDWAHPNLARYAAQIEQVKAWPGGKRGILAAGESGRGKTRAFWHLLGRLSNESREIRFFTAHAWFARLGQEVRYGSDDAQGWVESVAKAPVVFIDDLGQQALTKAREEWAMQWFFSLLDIRLNHGLPLFVTTNLTAPEIAGRADKSGIREDPLLRRLLELCEVVKF